MSISALFVVTTGSAGTQTREQMGWDGSQMADDWIKMRCNLPSDPAVIGIASDLNLDEDTVVGKLHRIWSWADQQTVDGNAPSVTGLWVDRYVGCVGFFAAMTKQHWGEVTEVGLRFPNFNRHNGQSAKRRGLTAKRVAISREKDNPKCNAASVTGALPEKEKEKSKILNTDLSTNPPTAVASGNGELKEKPKKQPTPIPRKPPTGPHAELITHFVTQWELLYGTKYVFAAKDGVAASKILAGAGGDLDKAMRIVAAYLACAEPFIVDKRHPLTLLLSQINQFTGATNVGSRTVISGSRPSARAREAASGQYPENLKL